MSNSVPTVQGSLRLGFAGTPGFAVCILQALIDAGRTPVVVYTQPDRAVGRGRKPQPSPIKKLALARGLPVRQPDSLRSQQQAATLQLLDLDLLVVAAYGLLLPPGILAATRLGCVNVHASLLPRWRGAAPIERAIMAGDTETGACIMQMDEGLDTGPVYSCRRCPITRDTTAPGLEARLAELGSEALIACLDGLLQLVPTPQPETGVSYARKLTRADSIIQWSQPAIAIERQVRALADRMAPFAEAAGGVRISILAARATEDGGTAPAGTIVSADRAGIRVACGEGALNVTRLKLNVGKGQPLGAADAINGYATRFAVGAMLREADPGP